MIRHFKCDETASLFLTGRSRRWSSIVSVAMRKLSQVNAVLDVMELKDPPGNRLEVLKGDRAGTYSIRINGQWRVCFRWSDKNAYDVEIVDYH